MGHRNTTVAATPGSTGRSAFALVPILPVGYVWHARSITRRCARAGLEGSGSRSWPGHLGQGAVRGRPVLVSLGPRAVLGRPPPGRPKQVHRRARQVDDLARAQPEVIGGGAKEQKQDHPTQKPVPSTGRRSPTTSGRDEAGVRAVPGVGHDVWRPSASAAAALPWRSTRVTSRSRSNAGTRSPGRRR